MTDAPFRGLEPFRRVDAPIFCERDRETVRLIQLIALYRGVLLYGESGAGKSSLVNAGLLPRAGKERWLPIRLRYQPIRGRELMIEPLSDDPPKGSVILAQAGLSLVSVADLAAELRLDNTIFAEDDRTLLLIFDQFEEIITLTADAAERPNADAARAAQENVRRFLIEMLRDTHIPVKVLFVFREDYLAKIGRFLSDVPNLMDQYMRLEAVRTESVERLISGPFQAAAFERPFAPELVQELTRAFTARYKHGLLDLSAVQIVCLQLWSLTDAGRSAVILRDVTIGRIVEEFLAGAIQRLEPQLRDAAVILLCEMVTSTGTRNVISFPALLAAAAQEGVGNQVATRALAALEKDAKVITRDARRDIVFFEIVSEFLVPWIMQQKDVRKERAYQVKRRKSLLAVVVIALALLGPAWFLIWLNLQTVDASVHKKLTEQVDRNSGAWAELQKERLRSLEMEKELDEVRRRAAAAQDQLDALRKQYTKEGK